MAEDITVMSVRGQVVIPQNIRRRLHLKPKDRLVVYGEEDTIIMKKLDIPALKETFKRIGGIVRARNRKHGKISEEEVQREVAGHRAGR